MPQEQEIHIYGGDDYALLLNFSTSSPPGPADVSDRIFRGQIRPRPGHETLLAEFTADMSNAAQGKVAMLLTPEQTAVLRRDAAYDIQMVVNGKVTTPFFGPVILLSRGVTVPDE